MWLNFVREPVEEEVFSARGGNCAMLGCVALIHLLTAVCSTQSHCGIRAKEMIKTSEFGCLALWSAGVCDIAGIYFIFPPVIFMI